MTIQFHCEHCGKQVEAPDSAGGRRGKCPYCKGSNYIPLGENVEELDLAPIDEHAERVRQQEVRDLIDAERDLLAETSFASTEPRLSERDPNEVKADDLHHVIVNYCLDMAKGNLERARAHVTQLRRFRSASLEAIDDFISGRTLEPVLDAIPVKVLQGFLTNLRSEVRQQE